MLSSVPRRDRPFWHRLLAGFLIVALEFAPLKVTIDGVANIHIGFNQAHAAPIADPAAPIQFRPTVTQTTGTTQPVPVVNITAPNAAGASLNQYQRFDIDPVGLILNNSLIGGGSLLGGSVAANPNLKGRTASVIVNEVTSSGGAFASQLNGSLEVFGAPAAVVIANPNGITCTACGFVNTPHITLTTGAPQFLIGLGGAATAFENTTAMAFNVQGGRVQIGGIGIEGTVGQVDIIADTIGVSAPIHAGQQINLITGRQLVSEAAPGQGAHGSDYQLSGNGATGGATTGLAIDASGFGAMQAGQIKIIATGQGLGVKTDGALAASTGELTISANGDVKVGAIYAKQDLTINAAGNLVATGDGLAEQNLALTAGGNLTTNGSLEARENLTLTSGGDQLGSGNTTALKNIILNAGDGIAMSGANAAGDKLLATAGNDLSLTGSSYASNGVTLDAQGRATVNNVTTPAALTVTAGGDIVATGSVLVGQDATLVSQSAIGIGGDLGVGGYARLDARTDLSLSGATQVVGGADLTARAGDIANRGAFKTATLAARAGQSLVNSGTITATGDAAAGINGDATLTAIAGNLTSSGVMVTAGDLKQTAGLDIANSGGTLVLGNLNATAGNSASFGNATGVVKDFTVSAAQNITVAGATNVLGNTTLTATAGDIATQGELTLNGELSADAGRNLGMSGNTNVVGVGQLSAGRDLTVSGSAVFANDLAVQGQTITLQGAPLVDQVKVLGKARFSATQGDITNNTALSVRRDLTLDAQGNITGAGDINTGARDGIGGSAALTAQQGKVSLSGKTTVGRDLTVGGERGVDLGTTTVFGDATLAAASGAINLNGDTLTGGDLSATAKTHLTTAGVKTLGGLSLTAQGGGLTTGGRVESRHDMTLTAGQALTLMGATTAGRDENTQVAANATLTGASVANNGVLTVSGDLSAKALSGDLGAGDITVAGSATLSGTNVAMGPTLVGGDLSVSATRDIATGNQWVTRNTFTYQTLVAGNATFAAANGTLDNRGQVNVGGDLSTAAVTLDNRAGAALSALGRTTVSAPTVVNRGIVYGKTTTVTATNILDNGSGSLLAEVDLDVKAGSLTSNRGGVMASNGNASLAVTGPAAVFDNTGGKIQAKDDLHIDLGNGVFDPLAAAAGELNANGLFAVKAKDVVNSGVWKAPGSALSLDIQASFSNSGRIEKTGDISIKSKNNISNTGEIVVGGNVILDGTSVTNVNTVHADQNVTLTASAGVVNRGTVEGLGTITVAGAAFDNSGAKTQANGDIDVKVSGQISNVGGTISSSFGNVTLTGSGIDNDRAPPIEQGSGTTRGYNASLLNSVLLRAAVAPTCGDFGNGYQCTGGNPELRIGDLNPDYASNTVTIGSTGVFGFGIAQTFALPQTVRSATSQTHGAESHIIAYGDITLTAAGGTVSNRGGEIKAENGSVTIAAATFDQGRSTPLTNGVTEATDPADLARFVDQLNAFRGAGTPSIYWDGTQFVTTTVPTYTVNPLTTGSTTTTPGIAGTTRAGASASLTVGDLIQDGTLTARGNLKINGSGAFTNNGLTAAGTGSDLTITAASLVNGGELLAGRDVAIGTDANPLGALANHAGTIEAGRDLAIHAGTLTNQGGGTTQQQTIYLTADRQTTLTQYVQAVTTLPGLSPTVAQMLLYPETGGAQVYNGGNGRVKVYGPTNFDMDTGLQYLQMTFITTAHNNPGTITAARNASVRTDGALSNDGSVINAGGSLTVTTSSLSNSAAFDTYQTVASNCESAVVPCTPTGPYATSERSVYTVTTAAAGALQAATALSVTAGGAIVNSGNVYGRQVNLKGSSLLNGITDVQMPPLTSTTPGQVIPLAGPTLPASYGGAQSAASQASRAPVPGVSVAGEAPLTAVQGTAKAAVVNRLFVTGPRVEASGKVPGVGQGQFGFVAGKPAGEVAPAMPAGIGPSTRYLVTNPASEVLAPLTPDYLLALLPDALKTGASLPFYADPYVEQQLLRQAALTQTGKTSFIDGLAYDDRYQVSVDTQERAILYDNAAQFAGDHGLRLGQALTPEALGQLDRPMLWYVEQKVKDQDGKATLALVPTVYLPKLTGDTHLAGGAIQGEDVSLDVAGHLDNTGYITAAHTLSITAQDFENGKRNADLGRLVTPIDKGYTVTTGSTVQPGGFVAAADLSIHASRIDSISGEFQVLGEDQQATQAKTQAFLQSLRSQLGTAFTETEAQNDLHTEVHVDKGFDLTQLAIMVVAVAVSIYTAGAASGLIGEAAGATAGSGSLFAAGTTAGSLAGAGIGNVAVSTAIGSMASSAVTGALSGNFDFENVLKSGLTAGLTAGLTQGLIPGLDQGASWGDKVANWGEKALVSASVTSAVNGGSFETAFKNSFIANASASAANWVGDNAGVDKILGETGGVGHVAAHALVGCATAAAEDKDCAAGAIGEASSAYLTSFIDDPIQRDERGNPILDANGNTIRRAWTDGEKALVTSGSMLASGMVAGAVGEDATVAAQAAQNEALNNRLLHVDEYKLLHNKARDIAEQKLGAGASVAELKAAESYWYDLLVSEALATVEAKSRDERITYLQQIAASGQPGSAAMEGHFYAAGYLQDAQVARETVRNLAGNPILGNNGQAIIADGQALTTFQASPDQFRDHQLFSPTATVADRVRQFGDPLAAINANYAASQKANDSALSFIANDDQARLERFRTPNGQAAPNSIDLDIALGLGGPISAGWQELRSLLGEWGAARGAGEAAASATGAARIANNFYRDGAVLEQPYPKSLSEPISTSSDTIFKVSPDKTTTVLGSFGQDMEEVIGQQLGYPKTIDFGARPGAFNVLNVPDGLVARLTPDQFWEIYNKPFLDAAIRRGDDIVLATKPELDVLVDKLGNIRGLGREIKYLESLGYRYDSATGHMTRKGG